jgi:NADH-quinone oxidoreductase subunit G
VLHTAASRVGGLDLGFVPGAGGKTARELVAKGGADVLFLLGADEMDLVEADAFTSTWAPTATPARTRPT